MLLKLGGTWESPGCGQHHSDCGLWLTLHYNIHLGEPTCSLHFNELVELVEVAEPSCEPKRWRPWWDLVFKVKNNNLSRKLRWRASIYIGTHFRRCGPLIIHLSVALAANSLHLCLISPKAIKSAFSLGFCLDRSSCQITPTDHRLLLYDWEHFCLKHAIFSHSNVIRQVFCHSHLHRKLFYLFIHL